MCRSFTVLHNDNKKSEHLKTGFSVINSVFDIDDITDSCYYSSEFFILQN